MALKSFSSGVVLLSFPLVSEKRRGESGGLTLTSLSPGLATGRKEFGTTGGKEFGATGRKEFPATGGKEFEQTEGKPSRNATVHVKIRWPHDCLASPNLSNFA